MLQIDPKEIDAWNQDLQMAFTNDVRFSFYLSFRVFAEFEKIFGENFRMICAIKRAKPEFTLVDKIVVRINEAVSEDTQALYHGVTFLGKDQKI